MPIVRILLILLTFVSPAMAADGLLETADATEAAKAFQVYIDGVAKKGERPDMTRPDVAALLGRVYDLDAMNALPPAEAKHIPWLLDWTEAANSVYKLITRYGSKPGPQPDLEAVGRNMMAYEDQIAAAMNFMIRLQAREAVSVKLFMAELPPDQRTRIREEGFARARRGAAEYIMGTVCAAIVGSTRPANARLVAAAISDTRDIWAGYLLPQDRPNVIKYITSLPEQIKDEKARTDLVAFSSALQAVD